MFEELLEEKETEDVEDYQEFKRNYSETPLKKSINIILDQITLDIVKILKYDKI